MSDPLPSSFEGNEEFYQESRSTKLLRRLREEPLVPLGIALTCWALFGATRSIRKGDHHEANRMFRRRIYAQGFTVLAMVAGSIYWSGDREKRKELQGIMSEAKRKEKHEKWLRELEARDEEDKMVRAQLARAREERQAASQIRPGDAKSVVETCESRGMGLGILQTVIDSRSRQR